MGVLSCSTIPAGRSFGPIAAFMSFSSPAIMIGHRTTDERAPHQNIKIDVSASISLDWVPHVQSARDEREQNMEATLENGRLYYRTTRTVHVGSELLVWYSREYASTLAIPDLQACHVKEGGTFSCPYCLQYFRFPNSLRAHIRFRCRQPTASLRPPLLSLSASMTPYEYAVSQSTFLPYSPFVRSQMSLPLPLTAVHMPPLSVPVLLPSPPSSHESTSPKTTHLSPTRPTPSSPTPPSPLKPNSPVHQHIAISSPQPLPTERIKQEPYGQQTNPEESRKNADGIVEMDSVGQQCSQSPKAIQIDQVLRGTSNTQEKPKATKRPAQSVWRISDHVESSNPVVESSSEKRTSSAPSPTQSKEESPSRSPSPGDCKRQRMSPTEEKTSSAFSRVERLAVPSSVAYNASFPMMPPVFNPPSPSRAPFSEINLSELYRNAIKSVDRYKASDRVSDLQALESSRLQASLASNEAPPEPVRPSPAVNFPLHCYKPSNPMVEKLLSPIFTSNGASQLGTSQNWCAKCNASFRMTSDLVYHMRSHHQHDFNQQKRKREEKLRCSICGESFRERHHLTRHMTSHAV